MINRKTQEQARSKFRAHYGEEPAVIAYAPGRAEILGNHTDYNEGFVLSLAINYGTYFLAAPEEGRTCRLVAGDLMEEVAFPLAEPQPVEDRSWPNYIIGVLAELEAVYHPRFPFKGLFFSNVPRGAGLSSSAALSMSAGLALANLYSLSVDSMELARYGQKAENDFVGVRTGLLDQISSLYGKRGQLVMTDFRSLEVQNVAMGAEFCFLACNTRVKHSLVNSAYNDRRASCEEAVRFFAGKIHRSVTALRDVGMDDWRKWSAEMDPVTSRRAVHVIGENQRVLNGQSLLAAGKIEDFGELMFESHESSRINFENSCRELDFLVERGKELPPVMGARLSGGGFGGSAIMLIAADAVDEVSGAVTRAYEKEFAAPCDVRVIMASEGAHLVDDS
jgi:galactokinase